MEELHNTRDPAAPKQPATAQPAPTPSKPAPASDPAELLKAAASQVSAWAQQQAASGQMALVEVLKRGAASLWDELRTTPARARAIAQTYSLLEFATIAASLALLFIVLLVAAVNKATGY